MSLIMDLETSFKGKVEAGVVTKISEPEERCWELVTYERLTHSTRVHRPPTDVIILKLIYV